MEAVHKLIAKAMTAQGRWVHGIITESYPYDGVIVIDKVPCLMRTLCRFTGERTFERPATIPGWQAPMMRLLEYVEGMTGNGQMVFEGDILEPIVRRENQYIKERYIRWVVRQCGHSYSMYPSHPELEPWSGSIHDRSWDWRVRVIGNIHSDPGLLERDDLTGEYKIESIYGNK